MQFNYGSEPARQGPVNDTSDLGSSSSPDIEKPVIHMGEIGQTVTEGARFGTFIQTVQSAIRTGASKVELQTNMAGGAEAVGAESYGKEQRQALRELAAVNDVELTSVHVPTQVGNVSGFNPQQGFVDEQRKQSVDEIKKAIDFAADVNQGGGITFHTGEFQRAMSEQDWAVRRDAQGNAMRDKEGNLQYNFLSYEEEPGKAVTYMVDQRNGRIIGDVRKSNTIREPEYLRADHSYMGKDIDGNSVRIEKGDLITEEGEYIDMANVNHLFKRVAVWDDKYHRFKTTQLAWEDIEERRDEWNQKHPENRISSEEMAYRIQIENQILQYRGSSLYHGRFYKDEVKERDAIKKSLKFYEDLEKNMSEEEVRRIMKDDPRSRRYAGPDLTGYNQKKPSELLRDALMQAEQSLQYTHQASSSADAQADTLRDTLLNVVPVAEYAKHKSSVSTAEAGIYAMMKTKEKKLDKDIFLTPENIFPEMGYGSHPEELKQFVIDGRKKMVELLTAKKIQDPHNRIELVKGNNGDMIEKVREVDNPFYRSGMSKSQAEEYAVKHIKANLDTQHLGMWSKHFQPIYLEGKGRMETEDEKNARFDKWYMDEVKKLAEGDKKEGKLGKDIIGELHIVDGMHGGSHVHLPTGQGTLPVVNAVEYLKSKGFKGIMMSEGHGEESWGPGRIMTKTWEAFGSPVSFSGYGGSGQGGFGAPLRFSDVNQSYFQQKQSPYFVFGGYSPSNDWTLWSEVPLE